jgi:hypothetical protein
MTSAALKAERNALQTEAQQMAHSYPPADLAVRRAIREQIHRLNREIARRRHSWAA